MVESVVVKSRWRCVGLDSFCTAWPPPQSSFLRVAAPFFARDKLVTAKAEFHAQSAIGRRPCIRTHAANPEQQGSVCWLLFRTAPAADPTLSLSHHI